MIYYLLPPKWKPPTWKAILLRMEMELALLCSHFGFCFLSSCVNSFSKRTVSKRVQLSFFAFNNALKSLWAYHSLLLCQEGNTINGDWRHAESCFDTFFLFGNEIFVTIFLTNVPSLRNIIWGLWPMWF